MLGLSAGTFEVMLVHYSIGFICACLLVHTDCLAGPYLRGGQWRRLVLQVEGANIWGPVDGGTEGPERGAVARSAGAPRGVAFGEGRRSPSPVWGFGGYAPRKFFFQKINLEIGYFRPS